MATERSAAPAQIFIPKLDACWFATPPERSPNFFPVFARVSDAVQQALREHVPSRYFEDLENFRNPKTAYPMLLYQASQPYHGKMRTDLTYDVLSPKTLARLFRTVKLTLPELLDRVESRLHAAGLNDLAAKYARRKAPDIVESVQRLSKSRKCLYILIRAEAVLVNGLVELGGLGRLAAKEQTRRVASFEKKWAFQLRRLYPGTDFTWLAPVLLEAATQALTVFQSLPSNAHLNGGAEPAVSPDPKSIIQ